MKEERIHELFREMRDEAVPGDSLRRVRLSVAERTRPRFAWWRWGVAAAALAACVVLVVFLWPRQKEVVAPRQDMARHVEPVMPVLKAPQENRPVAQPVTKHVRKPKVSKHDSGVVIRIETPDPDVVILLIGD